MKTSTRDSTLATAVNPRVRGLFLKNLGEFQTELARVTAGFLPAMVVWKQRKELPALIFRLLRCVQDLRQRGRELGVSFEEMHLSSIVAKPDLIEAICDADSCADFHVAMITTHRVLIDAIEDYLERNKGIYDLPSVSLLETNRDELKSQIVWAETALREIACETSLAPNPEFLRRIQSLAVELPATLREHSSLSSKAICESRRIGNLPFADAKLPLNFRNLEFGPETLPENPPYSARERYHAVNFLQEVQAADSCASMLFESPDMPWNFFFDLSRHMWDESRHAMFGERKLLELGDSAASAGLSTKAYAMRQTLTPLDRYAALSTQEADAFPGKHVGLKDAVAHQDSTSAMAWSYDIADETQHLRFGTKWIPVMREKVGDPRSVEQIKEDACNWRVSVLAEVYKPAAATFK